jgi:N-acetylglucosamine-6-sulfatase
MSTEEAVAYPEVPADVAVPNKVDTKAFRTQEPPRTFLLRIVHRQCELANEGSNCCIAASRKPCAKFRTVTEGGDCISRVSGALLWPLLCLVAFLTAGCLGSETLREAELADSPSDRPNIVFVLTDDLDVASAQKMSQIRSLLIEEGTSFENAFVSYPLCCPSRATILTGLYAHNHGVKGNHLPYGGFQKFRDGGHEENAISARLQQVGYRTGYFGKYLNDYPGDDPTHIPPGWDEWHAVAQEKTDYHEYDLNENGEVVSYEKKAKNYLPDALSDMALEYVRGTADNSEPFFLYLSPPAPHLPASVAKRYRNAFAEEASPRPPSFDEEDVSDKPLYIKNRPRLSTEETSGIANLHRRRLESMLAVDEMVASLIQELEAVGELDNTFIFFTSDNGWEQGEHRISMEKGYPYEESARVPFFVRGPGVAAGVKTDALTLNTDFAPTLADLAGASFTGDGRSLTSILRGEEPSSWRSAVLLEGWGENVSIGLPPEYKAVRTESHKYVEYVTGERELYDLKADPYELENVYKSADPTLVKDLKTRLDALRSCAEAGCREAEDEP